ncbi:MAG: AMP-binding protein [Phycisphaerales bacterium]|nr:AMP-binding protein [Phycisphaerales bacterium]
MSIHWPIVRSLLSRPRHPFIVDDQRTYRGVEIVVAAMHAAEAIARAGSSQTVGILLPAGGGFPIAALGAWFLGRTVVPLNFLLKKEELQYVVDDCGCDTIVSATPMLSYLGDNAPTAKTILKLDDINFRSMPDIRWPARVDDDDVNTPPGVILYTSGTSGRPKGVMLSHANIQANARQVMKHVSLTRDDIMLGVLPQFHSFGLTVLTLMPLTYGMKTVNTARFAIAKVLDLMKTHRPTIFVGIPSMYNLLLHAKSATPDHFSSLRYIVSGGEPLPRAVFDGFKQRFGVTINEGYGLTETSPVTNWCRPEECREGSVGPALPEIEQRIVELGSGGLGESAPKFLPPETDGEVWMRGPNLMRGYYKKPQETAAVFSGGIDERGRGVGYFRTGDIGRLDADGHLFITGRLKEMLIIGGENVFPREIEEVLDTHPLIHASGVVGKPDDMRGEVPVAFVELKEGVDPSTFNERDAIALCRQRLAGYKVPDQIRVTGGPLSLPRNPTGKIMRRELKKMV